MTIAINPENWGVFQGALIAMYVLWLLAGMMLHGSPRPDYDCKWNFIDAFIMAVLLIGGGFFA